MAELFGVTVPNISYHLKNIFHSGELSNETVIKEILIPAQNGVRGLSEGKIKYYNLDVIISVGYRVNSILATNFRIWATKVLKEYMIKGFVLDDERLKKGGNIFGKEYFDELLERVQEIRASERLFYQKLTDIFAETFTPVFRTNLNMPSLAKLPLKSSHLVRMPNTLRWDC